MRAGYHSKFLEYFGLPDETDLGCATMQPFDTSSSSSYPQSLDQDWAYPDQCKVVTWFTQYSIFRESDYKSCVCNIYHPDLPDCIDGQLATPEDEEFLEDISKVFDLISKEFI